MKIFIPDLDTKFQLTKDWEVNLNTYDNLSRRSLGLLKADYSTISKLPSETKVIIPNMSILKFFNMEQNPHRNVYKFELTLLNSPDSKLVTRPKATPRIKVTLDEINQIECEILEEL